MNNKLARSLIKKALQFRAEHLDLKIKRNQRKIYTGGPVFREKSMTARRDNYLELLSLLNNYKIKFQIKEEEK